MPRFVVRRSWVQLDPDHMARVVRTMMDLATRFDDVRWIHSHPAVDDAGELSTYCVYDASTAEEIRAHGLATGHHSVDEIHEVIAELGPRADGTV